ncbi:glutathione S-transferase domain-containing protein [Xylariaceae sp. FL1272]|nr:glutathione S-transferase domain-containing protein [Xylariaceae sp. FL1272]
MLIPSSTAVYEVIYWPGTATPRGHSRLALEGTDADHSGFSHLNNYIATVAAQMRQTSAKTDPPPFARLILKHDSIAISWIPNISMYLRPRYTLISNVDVYHHSVARQLSHEDKRNSICRSKECHMICVCMAPCTRFPRRATWSTRQDDRPERVSELHNAVRTRPNIVAYLSNSRRDNAMYPGKHLSYYAELDVVPK